MDAKRILKMFGSGDSDQINEAAGEMRAAMAKLWADVEMLKAQGPIIVPQSTYRVVSKVDDDPQHRH